MELLIRIDGQDDTAIDELWDWLCDEPALRGYLARRVLAPPPGTMAAGDVAIVLASAASLVTAVTPLAKVLSNYLLERSRQRRPPLAVNASGSAGEATIDQETVSAQDCERMLRAVIRAAQKES